MNLFLTATDTDAGKTFVSTLIIRALRRAGVDAVGMKPFCCGSRADAEALWEACDRVALLDVINPVYYESPTAPLVAAKLENRASDLERVRAAFLQLCAAHGSVIVEGVGGWMVPIMRDYFVADLAAEMALPIAVVVRNRLGALNHALLTVRDIERRGLPFAGIIFNRIDSETDPASATNREILEDLLARPVLFEIASGQSELPIVNKA